MWSGAEWCDCGSSLLRQALPHRLQGIDVKRTNSHLPGAAYMVRGDARTPAFSRQTDERRAPRRTKKRSAFAAKLDPMNKCPYCEKIRDEWDCHGSECRAAIAKALRRQRQGLPMVPKLIRNEIPAGASTGEVIARLSRQRLRARRGNEERRERKEIDNTDVDVD
jgi:hypothetical protein